MSLKVDIFSNIKDLENSIVELKTKDVVASARRALNRTIINARKKAAISIREVYPKLKAGDFKKRTKLRRAKGSQLNNLESAVSFSDKSLSMVKMVVGSKLPQNQKGVPVKKRKAVRVMLGKGKRFKLKKAFIARVNAGDNETTHVFKRTQSGRLAKQSLASVGISLKKEGHLDKIGDDGLRFFKRQMDSELNYRMIKIKEKLNRSANRIK